MENRIDIKVLDVAHHMQGEFNKARFDKDFNQYINELKMFYHSTKNKDDYTWFLVTSCYETYVKLCAIHFDDETKQKSINKSISILLKIIDKNLNKVLLKNKSLIKVRKNIDISKNTIIKLEGVYKYYTSKKMATKILSNINLEIKDGDFVVILGSSGSGKTTLMNLMSGMDKPSFGNVYVDGYFLEEMNDSHLTQFRKNVIGYVFQRYGLLPNLTIYENILMGEYLGRVDNVFCNIGIYKKTSRSFDKMRQINDMQKVIHKRERKKVEQDVNKLMEVLELKEFANKYPYELSGGQKQRTSIARTIAKKPRIIFGDEPTGAVDSQMSQSIIEIFSKINSELKTTIIIITHDETISKYANKVIYVNDGCIEKIINKDKGKTVENENKKN